MCKTTRFAVDRVKYTEYYKTIYYIYIHTYSEVGHIRMYNDTDQDGHIASALVVGSDSKMMSKVMPMAKVMPLAKVKPRAKVMFLAIAKAQVMARGVLIYITRSAKYPQSINNYRTSCWSPIGSI